MGVLPQIGARGLLAIALLAAACQAPPLEAPAGSFAPERFEIAFAGANRSVEGAVVTPDFFTAATTGKVRPVLGRLFVPEDYKPASTGVVVLGHALWSSDVFQSRPEIIGSQVTVAGRQRVVVGVTPPEFQPVRAGGLWIPKAD